MSTDTTARVASGATDKARRVQGPVRGGLDLGGTKIEAIAVDRRNRVLGSARRPTPTSGGPADVAAELARAVSEACAQAGIEPHALSGVGVGSPGSVDPQTGAVANARNLPGWQDSFPLAETLSSELGTSVRVGNDVQVATDAEFKLGAGKPYRSILGVFWGTGVGGGLDPRPQAVARTRGGRRDRPHGHKGRRQALPMRTPRTRRGATPVAGRWRRAPASSPRKASTPTSFI